MGLWVTSSGGVVLLPFQGRLALLKTVLVLPARAHEGVGEVRSAWCLSGLGS